MTRTWMSHVAYTKTTVLLIDHGNKHTHRDMAEPNEGFCEQLRALQRDKFFSSLHSSIQW